MFRIIPTCLLLAAFVTSGSALAARTTESAQAGGQATKQPPGKPAAPAAGAAAKGASAPVTPADAAPLMGTWQIPLETPTGRLVANLVFRTEAGKVVAGVSAPQFPEHKITDITKSGQVVTLKASADYAGPLTAYSGPVTMVLTLKPKGPDLAAWFDFNNAGFQLGGTAKKKS
jgi:Rieske Fe-S protein